jgi:Asp-tRNA(Asn)/Glu-tRNA(Gln) amidotransferase A subunit family amidase
MGSQDSRCRGWEIGTSSALTDSVRPGAPDLADQLAGVEALFAAREPGLRAFLPEPDRFKRLRLEAADLLARFPEGVSRPTLFGVLAGIKDIFRVDGFPTEAGSRLPPEEFAGPEAEAVTRLRSAGTLILGKTVTTEFAYFSPGPTRNPHNPEHTPGGSSSGSAAAVAAGLCELALGTQTIGSIIRPAAFCGVVGLKPSYERISREGVIPLAPSFDHVGLFTPDVSKAVQAAAVLYKDWGGLPRGGKRPILGIPRGPYLEHAAPEGMANFERACARLKAGGYEIRPVPVMGDFEEISARHRLIVAGEAARVHAAWFKKYGDLYAGKTAELIRQGQAVGAADLHAALTACGRLRDELTSAMEAYTLDLWVAPSAPGVALQGLESTGDPVMNLPWTQAGLPALTLPSGVDEHGLPFGLQLIGRWRQDESLLAWAPEIQASLGAS